MAEIGKMNLLKVVKTVAAGAYLDGGEELGEVLLPKRYLPLGCTVDDRVNVFLSCDSEDRVIATTEKPLAMVDEFACLEVVSVTGIGAFLDWGMPKDLLVPFREQRVKMRQGEYYVVRVYLDRVSRRLAASTKLDKFLDKTPAPYKPNDEVDLMIAQMTDLGFKAIINNGHWGMIFHNEVFMPLHRGQQLKGFVKQVRADGKIDLSLQRPGYEKVTELTDIILNYLQEQGGFMPITDKNPPEEIAEVFGVSKKTYKKAVGSLYKQRLITFENGGTKLV